MHPAAILPFFSTLAGGYAALRLHHRLHVLMALAAGVVVATAVADLLPEAFELAGSGGALGIGVAVVSGFIGFSFLEAFLHQTSFEHGGAPGHDHAGGLAHRHDEDHDPVGIEAAQEAPRTQARPGIIGLLPPSSLVVHSAMDGVAIGLGFQAGESIGLIVLIAVLAHDFADGMNIVTLALDAARGRGTAVAFLVLDAIAAPAGALLSTLISIEDATLGLLLAVFAGIFLAIGAGHLLPESQHRDPRNGPVFVALAGLGAAIVLVVRALAPV
ncbi:MAG TPA: ZIP family metal transporter [Candidatus Limnocylindrales bacterium]|jgi:ZIP family zinc transporter|nr:ZIP family metal transporter [Candidatus Limnocylindrales bacterium]